MENRECRIRAWSLLFLACITGAIVMSANGALPEHDMLMPAMILLPVAVSALAIYRSPALRATVLSLDTGVLVILHSWRVPGLGFLLLYAHDVLPGLFAWLAGAGDALAALGATLIGIRLLCGESVSVRTLKAWNSFGLLDFVIAVTAGTALRSAWFGDKTNTDVMASLPLSLIPTLIVPACVITHLIIFLLLRHKQAFRSAAT
jgi:hypothetical protein